MKVTFLTKNTINAEVCDHPNGAVATYSDNTDTRNSNSDELMEMLCFGEDIRVGAFVSSFFGSGNSGIAAAETSGVIKHDIYFPTDKWYNPQTKAFQTIPDYLSTTFTQAGVDAYGATLGASKSTFYPRHGQDMYDVSNGALGYDYVNGVAGASNQIELTKLIEREKDWLFNQINRNASSCSYRNGEQAAQLSYIPYFVSMRNSGVETINNPKDTYYGKDLGYSPFSDTEATRARFTSYQNSLRYYNLYQSDGETATDAALATGIQNTIANNGWFRNFSHWHDYINGGIPSKLEHYLKEVKESIGSDNVHTSSCGDAMEYMFLREITQAVTGTEKDGKVYVITDVLDSFRNEVNANINGGLPLETITVPLCVKIDLSSTSLAGQPVRASSGKMISLGNNEYIVQVPFDKREYFQGVTIREGVGGYYNTALPTATISTTSNTITYNSDQPCKSVLFYKDSADDDLQWKVAERYQEFKTAKAFATTSGNDYKIGLITEFGRTVLID